MTVTELAQALARHIAQGRGEFQVALFQWEHQSQPATELIVREGADLLELYSGTVPATPTDEDDDLLGFENDDLI